MSAAVPATHALDVPYVFTVNGGHVRLALATVRTMALLSAVLRPYLLSGILYSWKQRTFVYVQLV